jgi:hypothetical protein
LDKFYLDYPEYMFYNDEKNRKEECKGRCA